MSRSIYHFFLIWTISSWKIIKGSNLLLMERSRAPKRTSTNSIGAIVTHRSSNSCTKRDISSSSCSNIYDFMHQSFVGYNDDEGWYNVTLDYNETIIHYSSPVSTTVLGRFQQNSTNALYTQGDECNKSNEQNSIRVIVLENETLLDWKHDFLKGYNECVHDLIISVPKLCPTKTDYCRTTERTGRYAKAPRGQKTRKKSEVFNLKKPKCKAAKTMKSTKAPTSPKLSECLDIKFVPNDANYFIKKSTLFVIMTLSTLGIF